ncbi:hypothetical protein O3P69_014937 [Scylla paramamosain]|uniref:Uncharacterized protein n=1 Tax=Scylla paramamosain TaxID=85552 RepID=A0AAW0TZU2_SCYPA
MLSPLSASSVMCACIDNSSKYSVWGEENTKTTLRSLFNVACHAAREVLAPAPRRGMVNAEARSECQVITLLETRRHGHARCSVVVVEGEPGRTVLLSQKETPVKIIHDFFSYPVASRTRVP